MNNLPNDVDHLSDDLLSEWIDATLDAATQQRVAAHLAACAACATHAEGLQAVQATLHAMRQVESVPDFRLTAQGQPRRAVTRHTVPVARPVFARALLARLASAAVLLCGVFLIALALNGGVAHDALTNPTAGQSASGIEFNCPSTHCPANSSGSTASPVMGPGTARPTTGPTLAITPTPARGVSATTISHTSRDAPATFWPPIELAVGVVLAFSGLFTLVRVRRQ